MEEKVKESLGNGRGFLIRKSISRLESNIYLQPICFEYFSDIKIAKYRQTSNLTPPPPGGWGGPRIANVESLLALERFHSKLRTVAENSP